MALICIVFKVCLPASPTELADESPSVVVKLGRTKLVGVMLSGIRGNRKTPHGLVEQR